MIQQNVVVRGVKPGSPHVLCVAVQVPVGIASFGESLEVRRVSNEMKEKGYEILSIKADDR